MHNLLLWLWKYFPKVILTCLQLSYFTPGDIAHAVNGKHIDIVGVTTLEVWEDAGLWACLTTSFIFFHTQGLDNVVVSSSADLPLHAGFVGRAGQLIFNTFRSTRHWRRKGEVRGEIKSLRRLLINVSCVLNQMLDYLVHFCVLNIAVAVLHL